MKKMTFLVVVAMLCLFFKGNGQQIAVIHQARDAYKPLKIGDKVPKLIFRNVLNTTSKELSIDKLYGKAIILDFWATWCSSCIKGFPYLEALQEKYSKSLQVVMVDNGERDKSEKNNIQTVFDFIAKRKASGEQMNIPILVNETVLEELFPNYSLPHYVLIGPDGRVKAITGFSGLTDENIKRLTSGLDLYLRVKEN